MARSMKRSIRVNTSPVADRYGNEKIIEFDSANLGIGGLVSFLEMPDGTLRIDVYRTDPGVSVYGPGQPDSAAAGALPLAARAPEVGELLGRIRDQEAGSSGGWPGGDTVSILCEWFTGHGYDINAPLPTADDDSADDDEPSYEGYAKHSDDSVYSLQCSEGRHRACPQGPDDDETGLPPGGPMFDGAYCECGCGHGRG